MQQLRNLPLGFLPTFEAAGRLGSFKAAASELHVTPAAVSQQMRLLQEALGITLFARRGRAIVLTAEGERYLRHVRRSLSGLVEAGLRPVRHAACRVLRLSTAPLIAHEFLLPRLPSLCSQLPGWELQIEATMRVVDFDLAEIDAAIRVGGGPWPGLASEPLGSLVAAPVCAPSVSPRVQGMADLARQPLIEVRGQEHRSFAALFRKHGVARDAGDAWRFETCLEAARAAEHGMGVALALFPIMTHWVMSGRLAVPLADREPLPGQLALVYRAEDAGRFPFAQLATWLAAEFRTLRELEA